MDNIDEKLTNIREKYLKKGVDIYLHFRSNKIFKILNFRILQ